MPDGGSTRKARSTLTPRYDRCSSPFSINWVATAIANWIGIAKPIPSLTPELLAIAVLIPTTSPRRFINGPPLLPGLIAASVWMKS